MAKARSGYKRSAQQAPEGVEIMIEYQEIYEMLAASAKFNRRTIGQLAEQGILYALSDNGFVPPYRYTGPLTKTKRFRCFTISQNVYDAVEHRFGQDQAQPWIKKTLLGLAAVTVERIRGEQAEHEWREKYRI